MRVKVIWNGEGEPEGGIYEYGFGTDHPKIPQGITRQKDDPDSNWDFQYVGQDNSSLKMYNYLNRSVWFYTVDGQEYFTANSHLVPKGADNIKQGKYADVYRIAAQETRDPKVKSPFEPLDKASFAREKKLFDQLARTMVKLAPDRRGDKNIISVVPDAGGEYSLLSLYIFAVKTGNDSLVSQLNSWVGKKTALQLMTSDFFAGDRFIADVVKTTPAMPIASAILGARNWTELNSNMAKIYASIQSKIDGFEEDAPTQAAAPAAAPARAIPEQLVQPDIVPPTPINQPTPSEVMQSRIEFVPDRFTEMGVGSDDFAKKYAASEVNSGMQYTKNIPDMVISDVFSSLADKTKKVLAFYLAGFVKKTDSGYMVVPKEGRHFRPTQPLSKAIIVNELMGALAEFESALNKRNVEFEITNSPTNYSPLITMDFPYMYALGRDSEKVFAALQGAFFVSLKNKMLQDGGYEELLSDIDGEHETSIQLTDLKGPLVLSALSEIWSYKTYKDGDREMLSPLGAAVAKISEATGETPEKIQAELTSVLKENIGRLAFLKASKSTSQGMFGGKLMDFAGRAMGLAVSAHTNGLVNRPMTEKDNSLMYVSQLQLGKVLEQLLGERVEVSLGDTVTYYPSTSGKRPLSFSLGLLQYQHNYMPYYLNSEGNLMVEVAGTEYDLSKLEEPEKGKVLDAFMDRISSLCSSSKTGSIDSQDAIYHSLQKYQYGLYETFPEEASAVLGGQKTIEKVQAIDDIHNDSEVLQNAVDVISSLGNFIATDAEKWFRGENPDNLTPEELSSLGDDRARIIEMAFKRKADEISLQMPAILDQLGISAVNQELMTNVINDALGAVTESARLKMDNRGAKGKVTLDATQLGSIFEYMQLVVPIVSAVKHAERMGKSVELVQGDTGRGSFHTDISPEQMAGKPAVAPATSRRQSGFLRNRFTVGGFHLKVDGKDHYIVKEGRTGGTGDINHVVDPQGDSAVYPFEGKNSKLKGIQTPHLSQVSPMLKFILAATGSAKKVAIGKTGTIHTTWGHAQQALTPLGLIGSNQGNPMFFHPKFGVAKMGGSTIDYDRMIKVFSVSDGAGLECTSYS